MKIYVGCSLTHATPEFKATVEGVKDTLRKDFDMLDFVGLTAGTAEDVYRWDIHECIEKCEAFIAFVDHPALGLGYELGVAVEKLKKPTLALAQTNAHVTRLVLGIDAPHYTFKRYEAVEEIPKIIRDFLKERQN